MSPSEKKKILTREVRRMVYTARGYGSIDTSTTMWGDVHRSGAAKDNFRFALLRWNTETVGNSAATDYSVELKLTIAFFLSNQLCLFWKPCPISTINHWMFRDRPACRSMELLLTIAGAAPFRGIMQMSFIEPGHSFLCVYTVWCVMINQFFWSFGRELLLSFFFSNVTCFSWNFPGHKRG